MEIEKEGFLQKHDYFYTFALFSILLLGASLRLLLIGKQSYWFDEIYSIYVAQENLNQILLSHISLRSSALYYVLLHFWVQIFGTSETSTRLISAIFGSINVLLIFEVGKELFLKKIGIIAAFLNAISHFQIYISQEARCYALFELLTLLSYIFFIKYLKTKKPINLILYGFTNILLYNCHLFGLFVIFSQILFILLNWKNNKEIRTYWIVCTAIVLVIIMLRFLPNIYSYTIGNNNKEPNWIPDPTFKDIVNTFRHFIFPLRYYVSMTAYYLTYAIGITFFILGNLFFIFLNRKKIPRLTGKINLINIPNLYKNQFILVILWMIIPILAPFLLSKIITPMYQDKYSISASPALYLLFAYGISRFKKVFPIYISIITLLIIITPGLQYYYTHDVKEQWRESAIIVEKNSLTKDIILFAHDMDVMREKSFYWYYKGKLQSCKINDQVQNNFEFINALDGCVSGFNRFWLVVRGPELDESQFKGILLNPVDFHLLGEYKLIGVSLYLIENTRP
jgi:uncharacterized membrane protein